MFVTGPAFPGEPRPEHAGEELPIVRIPDGIDFTPGHENVHAGKGDYYTLNYGPFAIVMNRTSSQSYTLAAPVGESNEVRNTTLEEHDP